MTDKSYDMITLGSVRTYTFLAAGVALPAVADSGMNWDKSCVFQTVPAYGYIAPMLVCRECRGACEGFAVRVSAKFGPTVI